MKVLRVAKNVKGIEFIGVWGEFKSKGGFQGLALVLVGNRAQWEGFGFCFSGVFC